MAKAKHEKCHGARCKNCDSTDIYWIHLDFMIDTMQVRWCWTCGNRRMTQFTNVFNGEDLKPRFKREGEK